MTTPSPRRPNGFQSQLSRRAFLERLAATGAVVAGGAAIGGCSLPGQDPAGPSALDSQPSEASTAAAEAPDGRVLPGAVEDRILVVVDLQGGNDGLSTLVPYASGRYHDLRPTLAVPDEEVLPLDDEVGLHPSLARLHARGITTIEGVGPVEGDLSHFDMTARWERGDATGQNPQARTGFLGRCCDALDEGSPLVGLSLGGPTPHLITQRAATISLSSAHDLWFLTPSDWDEANLFQERLAMFGGDSPLVGHSSDSYRSLLDLAQRTPSEADEADWEQPMLAEGGDIGWKLYAAADLLAADVGTRIVYVPTGDYDTHTGHAYAQADNLARVDVAVDGFLTRMDDLGIADRVLVASISEFGRRVPENDSGLDHGNGSTMLLAGPVGDTRLGERPDLEDLDDDDNLRTAIGFDRYLGSLAQEWLGIEAASVLDTDPELLSLF